MKQSIFSVFPILIFSLSFFNLSAQKINQSYGSSSIYLKGTKYVKNGKTYPSGIFQTNLEKELRISPEAVIEFKKFKKNRSLALVFTTLALGSVLVAPKIRDISTTTGVLISGLGLAIVSIPISFKANNHFHKAIWLRNGTF